MLVQNVVYIRNTRNWNLLLLLRRRILIRFCLFFVLFPKFSGFVSFVTTALDKFQFQSQVRLSQNSVLVLIRLQFKPNAVVIEIVFRINVFFMGRQDIVNYWDFPSKIFRNCHRTVLPQIARYNQ